MARETLLHDTADQQERVILVAVEKEEKGEMTTESCLNELEELAKTAGAVVIGRVVQKRDGVHPGTYVGKGKVEEIKALSIDLEADGIICDDELTPSQMKNLQDMLQIKVMDRTMLILDIFAGRAISREGKIQVELAQLKYRLTRLTGFGTALSRLGGGIGTRGPGEKKLEMDRRYIKERISELNKEAEEIGVHRELLRTQRVKKGTPVVSMVGYTNAGKSTLLNHLTDAGVLAEDKLFATLDTTTRTVELPGGTNILYTDTVGFIQKLPHHLIQAFRATLEELKFADILIHVVDASNEDRKEQMSVVYETLKSLGCEHKPVITVFNKMDKNIELPLPEDQISRMTVSISAKNGMGLDTFLSVIETVLKSFRTSYQVLIPYADGAIVSYLHGRCEIVSEKHVEEGFLIEAYMDDEAAGKTEKYRVK
ncbi:MAG: GTPase HflX [Clostridiales bacterium]|nr:GTPase HflX [Clostridiales bacterium]